MPTSANYLSEMRRDAYLTGHTEIAGIASGYARSLALRAHREAQGERQLDLLDGPPTATA